MARPKKLNADYFPCPVGIKDKTEIKVLRNKFGHFGFSIYVMLLCVLTDADNFELELTDIKIDFLSVDLQCKPEQLKEIIEFCVYSGLIAQEGNKIFSPLVKKGLEQLVEKRERERNRKKEPESVAKSNKKGQKKTTSPKPKKKKKKIEEFTFIEDSSKLNNALIEFFKYRISIKKPLKDTSINKLVSKVIGWREKYTEDQIIFAIDTSIQNGRQGLFEPKLNNLSSNQNGNANRGNNGSKNGQGKVSQEGSADMVV